MSRRGRGRRNERLSMRYARTRWWLAACVATAACTNTLGPGGKPVVTAKLGQDFTLQLGQTAAVGGSFFQIYFRGVPTDTRCPQGALCITDGNARTEYTAWTGGLQAPLVINTNPVEAGQDSSAFCGAPPTPCGTVSPYQILLISLDPYPVLGDTLDPSQYKVTLRVDNAPSP